MQKKYTPKEKTLIRQRYKDLAAGKCICLHLIEAKCSGRISESEYLAAKRLETRCPLSTSGECNRCRDQVAQGRIDMYQAVRDIGIISKQLPLFDNIRKEPKL